MKCFSDESEKHNNQYIKFMLSNSVERWRKRKAGMGKI